jgi:acetyltransferase-like isoleucine patch superfamily enzyme
MFASGLKLAILKIVSHTPSQFIRKFIFRFIFGMKLAKSVVIYGGSEFRFPSGISIGKYSTIGNDCLLDGRSGLVIGENVNIGSGTWIWTLQHNVQSPDFALLGDKVIIHNRVWLCARCTILPGVEIGEGAVVATGAVVVKNVAPYTIVGGVPAKPIGKRNKNLVYNLPPAVPFI